MIMFTNEFERQNVDSLIKADTTVTLYLNQCTVILKPEYNLLNNRYNKEEIIIIN